MWICSYSYDILIKYLESEKCDCQEEKVCVKYRISKKGAGLLFTSFFICMVGMFVFPSPEIGTGVLLDG